MPLNRRTSIAKTTGNPAALLGTLLGGVILALAACNGIGSEGNGEAPADSLPASCEWADVVRVVDGDTIVIELAGKQDRVRYIGIDTPELSHDGNPEEPFARAATDANKKLLDDDRVCLERDVSERDQYDRLLRYVWLADGRMVNEELVREGMARVATFPPDVKYIDPVLLPAQRAARDDGLGIWSGSD